MEARYARSMRELSDLRRRHVVLAGGSSHLGTAAVVAIGDNRQIGFLEGGLTLW